MDRNSGRGIHCTGERMFLPCGTLWGRDHQECLRGCEGRRRGLERGQWGLRATASDLDRLRSCHDGGGNMVAATRVSFDGFKE